MASRGITFTEKDKKKFKEIIIKHMEETNGATLQGAAKKCDITYATIWNFRQKDTEFDEIIKKLLYCRDESVLDLAENQLYSNIAKGKEASIFFTLKTKGKERGYVERVESHNRNANFNISADDIDKERAKKISDTLDALL